MTSLNVPCFDLKGVIMSIWRSSCFPLRSFILKTFKKL